MSRLVDYYRGTATDTAGRRLEHIWAWNDDALEEVHDYIQWLFPLPTPSEFNPDAPLLTAEDIDTFRRVRLLRQRLICSFDRFLTFLGLVRLADGHVVDGPNLPSRVPTVWGQPNHNWLRVTRVLHCLMLLGLDSRARALFAWLEGAYEVQRFPIPGSTFRYWSDAVQEETKP